MDDLLADARYLAQTGQGRRARESAGASVGEIAAAVGVFDRELMAWGSGAVVPDGIPASDWVRMLRALNQHGERPLEP